MSPKEALLKIDTLVKLGHNLLSDISDDFRKRREMNKILDKKKEKEEEQKEKERRAAFPLLPTMTSFVPRVDGYLPDTVEEKIINEYRDKFEGWMNKCIAVLKGIYLDSAPVCYFINYYTELQDVKYDVGFYRIERNFEDKLTVLTQYYREVGDFVKSPLLYLEDKSQVWFNDFVVQLVPETNEAALCRYMFRFGIGEWREYAEIYEFIKGEKARSGTNWPKNWRKVVDSAYDGVNRKTKHRFNFPLIERGKMQLCLSLPSRFVANIK